MFFPISRDDVGSGRGGGDRGGIADGDGVVSAQVVAC